MVQAERKEQAMTAVHTRMTLAEFLALPERKPALEYEDGVVTQKVSPKGRHSVLQLAAANQINEQTVPSRLARAFPELRATFSTLSRVPDVAVYRSGTAFPATKRDVWLTTFGSRRTSRSRSRRRGNGAAG
jgi:Uma2 family endonuclease